MEVHIHKKTLTAGEWYRPFSRVCIPWLAGLLVGSVIASRMSANGLQTVRLMAIDHASFLGVLISSFIPFLIVAFVTRFIGRKWLQVSLFLKSTLLGLCFCYCARCFGTAGWLVAPLLFFADLVGSYCLLLFSFRLSASKPDVSKLVFFQYSGISVLFGMFNYFVLSPFTASLF